MVCHGFTMFESVSGCARLVLVRADPALRGRAAGDTCVSRAGFVRAHAPVPPCGIQARREPANSAGAGEGRRGRRRRRRWPICACVRVAPRRGLAAALRCARRRVAGLSPAPSHTATAVHHFCRGAQPGPARRSPGRRRRWPICACVRVAPRRGLAAASRCARPSCGEIVGSIIAHRRCSSSFLLGSPPALPPVLSQVRRAALASSDRSWVLFCGVGWVVVSVMKSAV